MNVHEENGCDAIIDAMEEALWTVAQLWHFATNQYPGGHLSRHNYREFSSHGSDVGIELAFGFGERALEVNMSAGLPDSYVEGDSMGEGERIQALVKLGRLLGNKTPQAFAEFCGCSVEEATGVFMATLACSLEFDIGAKQG